MSAVDLIIAISKNNFSFERFFPQMRDLSIEEKNRIVGEDKIKKYFPTTLFTTCLLFFFIEKNVEKVKVEDMDIFLQQLKQLQNWGYDFEIEVSNEDIYDVLFRLKRNEDYESFSPIYKPIFQWIMENVKVLPKNRILTLPEKYAKIFEELTKEMKGVIGRYKQLQKLGQGVYGIVFKVENKHGQPYALKLIKAPEEDELIELKEADLLTKFNHANVLQAIDCFATVFEANVYLAIVLPLAKSDLHSVDYEKIQNETKKLWIFQLLSAVHFLHKNNFYHCDVKPANVLIINDNAVLSDYGLANLNSIIPEACQSIRSPQQIFRQNLIHDKVILQNAELVHVLKMKSLPFQDDIWALGITIVFILIGKYLPYFDGDKIIPYLLDSQAEIEKVVQETTLEDKDAVTEMLEKLLHIDPRGRTNLLQLLANPLLEGRKNYVDGYIKRVVNDTPVIFKKDVKKIFQTTISTIISFECENITKLAILDLFYRVYEKLKFNFTNEQILNICTSIISKIYNESDFLQTFVKDEEKEIIQKGEFEVVNLLRGNFTRHNLIDELNADDYSHALEWLQEHPRKYEEFNFSVLASIIRDREDDVSKAKRSRANSPVFVM